MLRTHTCGELTRKEEGKVVTLCGWNHARRNHGGLIFIDLRDRYGLTQVTFDPHHNKHVHGLAEGLNREDVLQVTGKVRHRGDTLENLKLATGQIEVLVDELVVLNKAEVLPVDVEDAEHTTDEMRMKYRYLDLRRPIMQQRLLTRHNIAQAARSYLSSQKFLEVETPLLMKSTPEGARDYIVPSRVNPGKCYALPQSPQLYKQILMVSGCDRYFQLARCLRDEDLRADRQPEHTQIDIEMSFVEPNDVFTLVEGLFKQIFKDALGKDLKIPFQRLSYKECIERYGCDKPDLRFGLELKDLSSLFTHTDFAVFRSVIDRKGIIKAINAERCGERFSRKDIDAYSAYAQETGAKGLAWLKMTDKGIEGSIAKYFDADLQKKIIEKMNAQPGDLLFFCADTSKIANEVMNKIRRKLGEDLGLIDHHAFHFLWVTDFPLFEWNDEDNKWDMMHHMFCMPLEKDFNYLEEDPGKVHCTQYDLVLNGTELGSGSIRIHRPEIQERVMKVIGFTHEDAMRRFGFLLTSFKYGAPPHGGIGLGLDRIVALLCGLQDIREVIAFPKNKNAQCPMDACPSDVDVKQMKELHFTWDLKK